MEDVTPQIRSGAAAKIFVPPCPYPGRRWRHARRRRTDLIDDGEDGVDKHQVARLQRQVVGLLQSEQHGADQGDLSGAWNEDKQRDPRVFELTLYHHMEGETFEVTPPLNTH